MQEKKERNRIIYMEWKAGMEQYAKTGNRVDLVSYGVLGKKYEIDASRVMRICKRELQKIASE